MTVTPLVDADPGDECDELLANGDEVCLECGHVKGCATCSDIHEDAEAEQGYRELLTGEGR